MKPDHVTESDQSFKGRHRRAVKPGCRQVASVWERSRLFILFAIVFAFDVALRVTENKQMPIEAGIRETAKASSWLLFIMGAEIGRQFLIFVCEHVAIINRLFQGLFAIGRKMLLWVPDRRRYMIRRVTFWLSVVTLVSMLLARLYGVQTMTAIPETINRLLDNLPIVLQYAITFMFIGVNLVFLLFMAGGKAETYFPDEIKTTFDDVWGQDAVLERVRETITYLEAPDEIEARGGYVPSGILLWGPPGTGKTLMAEAVAGETGRPFVFVEPGTFTATFIGIGPLKVRLLFRRVRRLARRFGGVVVFFDEADALGNRGESVSGPGRWRGGTSGSYGSVAYLSEGSKALLYTSPTQQGPQRDGMVMAGMGGGGSPGVLQALLTEMNGMKKPRKGLGKFFRRWLNMRPAGPISYRVLIMLASNMPQSLDPALLRPGRVDRLFRVGYPSKEGRIRTYEGYLKKVRHSLTAADIDRLATTTPYATGAVIKDLVNEALINAMRAGRDVIEWADMMKAKLFKELGPPEGVEYVARERHATAIHEACHAVAAYRLRKHLAIDLATIEKGAEYLGMVKSIPLEDLYTRWRADYEVDIMVSLASLAGERMFFNGDSSSGVSGDLDQATRIALAMESNWGMGSTISVHSVAGGPGAADDGMVHAHGMGARVEKLLGTLYDQVRELLENNRLEVLSVAHALEVFKTVNGSDVEAVIDGRPGQLVDGSVYRYEGALALLEAYHTAAAEAHRTHDDVEAELPRLQTGPTPSALDAAWPTHHTAHDHAIFDEDGQPQDPDDGMMPGLDIKPL